MTHQTPLKRQASSEELDEGTRSRIRAEEVFRLQIRDTIAPPQSKSLLDKMAALLNTHVGVGTIGAVILAVATWSYYYVITCATAPGEERGS